MRKYYCEGKNKNKEILLCFYAKESDFDFKPYKLLVFLKLDNLNYIYMIFYKLNQN